MKGNRGRNWTLPQYLCATPDALHESSFYWLCCALWCHQISAEWWRCSACWWMATWSFWARYHSDATRSSGRNKPGSLKNDAAVFKLLARPEDLGRIWEADGKRGRARRERLNGFWACVSEGEKTHTFEFSMLKARWHGLLIILQTCEI